MRDYESAYTYYKKFNEMKEAQNLDIYRGQNAIIAMVYSKMGKKEDSAKFLKDYKQYADEDTSIYKNLSLAVYYSYTGNSEKSIENMKLFIKQDNYPYWVLLFLEIDPLIDPIKDHPEFKQLLLEMETKFWVHHEKIKGSLEEKGLI